MDENLKSKGNYEKLTTILERNLNSVTIACLKLSFEKAIPCEEPDRISRIFDDLFVFYNKCMYVFDMSLIEDFFDKGSTKIDYFPQKFKYMFIEFLESQDTQETI